MQENQNKIQIQLDEGAIMPVLTPELVQVDKIAGGDRGSRGFGSSGK